MTGACVGEMWVLDKDNVAFKPRGSARFDGQEASESKGIAVEFGHDNC